MAWEEDLEAYERNKKKGEDRNTLASQRNTLLSKQSAAKWTELRQEFNKIVTGINEKAGRKLITSRSNVHNEIRLEREDGVRLDGDWFPNLHKVRFNSAFSVIADREYGLAVYVIRGNDAVVWVPLQGNNQPETSSGIADLLISNFLRSEMV